MRISVFLLLLSLSVSLPLFAGYIALYGNRDIILAFDCLDCVVRLAFLAPFKLHTRVSTTSIYINGTHTYTFDAHFGQRKMHSATCKVDAVLNTIHCVLLALSLTVIEIRYGSTPVFVMALLFVPSLSTFSSFASVFFTSLFAYLCISRTIQTFNTQPLMSIVQQINSHSNDMNVITACDVQQSAILLNASKSAASPASYSENVRNFNTHNTKQALHSLAGRAFFSLMISRAAPFFHHKKLKLLYFENGFGSGDSAH